MFGEIVDLLFFMFIPGLVALGVVFSAKRRRTKVILAGLSVTFFIYVLGMHFYARKQVKPILRDFVQVVRQEEPRYLPDEYGTSLDYDGRLDRIVDRRNEKLRELGFIKIGHWYAGTHTWGHNEWDTQILYVCWAPWKLLS